MRWTLLVVCFSCVTCISFAKDKANIAPEPAWLYPVKADPSKKPDLKNISNGFYLELVDEQTNVINETNYHHFIRHIVNESGVQNASEVSVTFAPLYQSVVYHKVSVIRNGKVISQLNAKDIQVVQEETDVSEFQYNGIKRAFIILKDVRKDDRIDVSYSIVGFNPVYNNKFTTDIYFEAYNQVCNYSQTIITEENRNLHFAYFENAPHPKEEVSSGKHIYNWSDIDLKIWDSKAGSPSWYNPFPRITVSEFQNWSEVSNWALGVFDYYKYDLPAELENKVNTWKNISKGDKDEFARLAVRYVQDQIRYLGLEVGVHNYKPHHPKDVFVNGYGDCKDKALLLVTILRKGEIPAYIALLNTSKKSKMYDAAASPDEFNHAIVAMERNDSLQYIDATMSMQKGALKENYVPAYGYALVVRDNETDLRFIQPGSNSSIDVTETLKVSLNDSSKLGVRSTYSGGRADGIRSYFSESSMNDIKDEYVDYYRSMYKDAEMTGEIFYKDDAAANSVLVKEEYAIPELWTSEDKKRSFFVRAKTIDGELPNLPPSSEQYPLALKFPLKVKYTLKLEMPYDWSFPLDDVHIRNESYQFDFESEISGRNITCKYYLETFKDNIPANQLAQYKDDRKTMLDVTQFTLYYGGNGVAPKSSDNISWPAIWVTFIGFFLMSLLFRRLNRLQVDVEYDRDSGWKLGGWMVVLGITLCIHVAFHNYNLFAQGYYANSTWEILKQTKGVESIAYTELLLTVLKLSFCLAVLYWYFRRRDIFPKMFMLYVALLIASNLLLYMWYTAANLPEPYNNLKGEYIKSSFQAFLYGAIWCTYVYRSYRTRATFLKSYV
jgi:transglutaminase-like putative cysteine protease